MFSINYATSQVTNIDALHRLKQGIEGVDMLIRNKPAI
jgi:hypothetical protein